MGVALFPLDAEAGEPLDRVGGSVAEGADEVLVGAAAGDAHEVVEHLIGGVGARAELVGLMGKAHLGVGEAGVAAALGHGRLLDKDGAGARLGGAEGGGEAGDAAANDDDIELEALGRAGSAAGGRHGGLYGPRGGLARRLRTQSARETLL